MGSTESDSDEPLFTNNVTLLLGLFFQNVFEQRNFLWGTNTME